MNAIEKAVREKLVAAGLRENALDRPDATVMLPDGEGQLHVLLKDGAGAAEIDHLEAVLTDGRRTQVALGVEEAAPASLGGLGSFRNFRLALPPEVQGMRVQLTAVLRAGDASRQLPSFDATWARRTLLEGDDSVAVRPIPAGERNGTTFVEVPNDARRELEQYGIYVDDVVPAGVFGLFYKKHMAPSGALGLAVALGQIPGPVEIPRIAPTALKSAAPSGEDWVYDFLAQQGVAVPSPVTAGWLERQLNTLPADTPEPVWSALRERYAELTEQGAVQEASDLDDFLGNLGGGEEKPVEAPKVVVDAKYQQMRALQARQFDAVLGPLGVSEATSGLLAEALTSALRRADKPGVIVLSGPRYSAVDPAADLTLKLVTEKGAVQVGPEDLADPSLAGLVGNLTNEGLLSAGRIAASRNSAAGHACIYVRNVEALSEETLQALLKLVGVLARSGSVNAYGRVPGSPIPQKQEVSLARCAIVLKCEGDASKLRAKLAEANIEAVQTLGFEPLSPEGGVAYLEEYLARAAKELGAPRGFTVKIGDELRRELVQVFKARTFAKAYPTLFPLLEREVVAAWEKTRQPRCEVVGKSSLITNSEWQAVLKGEPVRFAAQLFKLSMQVASGEQVQVELRPLESIEDENRRLRQEVEDLTRRLETVPA